VWKKINKPASGVQQIRRREKIASRFSVLKIFAGYEPRVKVFAMPCDVY